jgi:hypothetical protein
MKPKAPKAKPEPQKAPQNVVKTTDDGIRTPNRLDLREAARRVTERERLLCPMNWPED